MGFEHTHVKRIYSAYALSIQSDVWLPLPSGKECKPDVEIRRRPLSVRDVEGRRLLHLDGEEGTPFRDDGGDVVTGRIRDELFFVVEKGEAIYYHLRKELEQGLLQSYLLGVLLATLLRQRGYLVLHACSVAKGGRAIAFVGESGWGKSTLAEYFCQRGYTLLNDDVLALAVDTQGEKKPPRVIPGYPQIRLREEAGRHLRSDFETLPSVNAIADKRATTPRHFPDTPLPLHKIYMLNPGYRERNTTEPLDLQMRLLRLIQHTRVTNLITDAAYKARHLRQCEHLVQSVPINQLHRIRDLNRIDEVYEVVEQDLWEGTAKAAEF